MPSGPEESSWLPSDWCSTEIRVRYAETDQMGVVYYSNYLVWFEIGRTEFCRQRGLPYKDFEREFQSYLAVAEAQCRYLTPARYDDVLIIRARVDSCRKRTIGFQYEIVNKESSLLVANGRTLHVLLDENGRPSSFPANFLHAMRMDEAFASSSVRLPKSAK
jgi:acyl-CoA thioester hydrolase